MDTKREHRTRAEGSPRGYTYGLTYSSSGKLIRNTSAYMVLTNKDYTKQFLAGAERVAARLGAGGLNHDSVCVGNNMDAEQAADSLFLEATELANKTKYQRPSTSGIVQIDGSAIGGLEYFDPDDVPVSMQAEVTINPNRIHETIGTLSPTGQPAHNSEPEVYFYHSDHLGSASWITDSNGKPIQRLQYLPFGEPFVDQRTGNYSERFRFTGKERDEETGYGYFGARYMDHELMTMWLSVDPMTDKYPSISPYAYCAWNPMKLVDPDGRDIWDLNSNGELIWREASENDRIYARDGSYIDINEGILTRGQSYTKESTDDKGYHLLLGNDAGKADQIFEFFADNTDVEFSLLGVAGTSEGKESEFFHLTCSFDREGDIYGSYYADALSESGMLRDATHNHPKGGLTQSGLPDSDRMRANLDWTPHDRGNDVGFNAKMIENLKKSAPSVVYSSYIYAPKGSPGSRNGRYRCYGSTNTKNIGIKYTTQNALSRYSR